MYSRLLHPILPVPLQTLLKSLHLMTEMIITTLLSSAKLSKPIVPAHGQPSLGLLHSQELLVLPQRRHVLWVGDGISRNLLPSILCLLSLHRHLLRALRLCPTVLLTQEHLRELWEGRDDILGYVHNALVLIGELSELGLCGSNGMGASILLLRRELLLLLLLPSIPVHVTAVLALRVAVGGHVLTADLCRYRVPHIRVLLGLAHTTLLS